MSHSSGINISSQLQEAFGSNKSSDAVRLFKVEIENETDLVSTQQEATAGDWEADFEKVAKQLKDNEAAYVLYRLDTKNQLGYEWVLFTYVPDKARVRSKMLYSSTKANLKLQLGGGHFSTEMFGTVPNDFTLQSYKKFLAHQRAEAPLTQAERDRKEEEDQGVFAGGRGTGSVPGVTFPVDNDVIAQLKSLKSGQVTYVQLIIDAEKERVVSGGSKKIGLSDLAAQVPIDAPRFHFFDYVHEHNGETLHSILYIYSCPDGSEGTKGAPVKLRMLYSSSKANVSNVAASAEITIAGKLEINKGSEITEETLTLLLHPPEPEKKANFSRPTKPGRGPARLTKK